jgi:radical SAM protein with 4Fe4S-binding SPASM domain
MGVGMVTNGVLVTREIARDIAKIGLTVTVSIDGMSRFHDWLRGRHTFELATQGIRTLVDTDVPTFVLMTVMKVNLDEIDNVTSLCEDLGVQQLMLTVLKARGRAVQLYDTQAPSQTDLFHLYEKLITRLVAFVDGRETMPLWFLCQPLFHTYLVKEKPEISRLLEVLPSVQCRAGRSRLMISSDGSVYVCPFIPAVVGNVKKMSLKEIWNESNSLVRLRDREFIGRCLQCEYKIPCGGCRARAYMTTGDLLESDPTCPW